MRCVSLFSLLAVLMLSYCTATAEDGKSDSKNTDKHRHHCHGTITKVDAGQHTITVQTIAENDKSAKQEEKTFKLTDDTKILNASGSEEKMEALKSGDSVCITEKDGKVTKVREHAQAKITKVDPKSGTVTVKMKDKNGKDVEKVFQLVEDTEYLDSTGRVAVLDVFRSGDDVLFLEANGKLEAMKKQDQGSSKKSNSK